MAATLAALGEDGLTRLLSLRPDLARPAPHDLSALASRAGAWPSARDAFHGLDRAAQRVVEALCLLDEPTTLAELASTLAVEGADPDLASALARLGERALAFVSDAGPAAVRVLSALRQLDYPARLGPPLAAATAGPPAPTLDQVAVRLGAVPTRALPATLAGVTAMLADPATVERVVAEGPPGTAELARRVATQGPLVRVDGGVYRVDDRTPAGWLLNRRMLVIVDYFTAVMPREPAVALRGGRVFPPGCLRRPEVALSSVDAQVVDRTAAEGALLVAAEVAALLELWDAEPAALLKAGGLGVREVHKVAKAIASTDLRAARIVDLAAVAGLVDADALAGMALPTPMSDAWRALEGPGRWAHLAGAWLGADLHLHLAGAIGSKDKPIPPLLNRAPERDATPRRRAVLAVLEAAVPGTAVDRSAVHSQVDWNSPALWTGGPASAPVLVSWVLEEAELLGLAALGSLATAGRALLSGRADAAAAELARLAPATVSDFVVQADLTAVVSGEPAVAMRAELDLFADVESKGAATVYRFSEASLRRAFDTGRTADDIVAFLERHATRGVPQPLRYLVTDLGRRFGNVRVGAVTSYVRSDDPSLLAEVLAARRAASLRLRRLAPTVLVTDVAAATVMGTLQAAGYLPAQEGADGTLLLARPPARRASARRILARHVPPEPDLAAMVAALLRRPPPAATPVARAALPPIAPADSLFAMRPSEIVKGSWAIRALLEAACEEFWLVRLSYVDSKGHSTELTVEPTGVDHARVYAFCHPRGNDRALLIDLIEWARVLTEAEEELLQ